ncbi:hypothetical protein E2C01_084498 [Portunus trituberculatus]|uniref:Uncharacterized protein n=1 Tax=Portunus trituberculatus TaxID=210409 RepID=A0A5B7J455_PORTR|nr:hypothetical protein [Portunus trituberculatus]
MMTVGSLCLGVTEKNHTGTEEKKEEEEEEEKEEVEAVSRRQTEEGVRISSGQQLLATFTLLVDRTTWGTPDGHCFPPQTGDAAASGTVMAPSPAALTRSAPRLPYRYQSKPMKVPTSELFGVFILTASIF